MLLVFCCVIHFPFLKIKSFFNFYGAAVRKLLIIKQYRKDHKTINYIKYESVAAIKSINELGC